MSTHNIGFHNEIKYYADTPSYLELCQTVLEKCDVPISSNHAYWNFTAQSTLITLVLLNPDIPCLCKQYRSRSVGYFSGSALFAINPSPAEPGYILPLQTV